MTGRPFEWIKELESIVGVQNVESLSNPPSVLAKTFLVRIGVRQFLVVCHNVAVVLWVAIVQSQYK